MTDRQVAIIAVVTVAVLVAGGAILARIQPDIRAVDMSGSREQGGERERTDGESRTSKSGGSGSDPSSGSGGGGSSGAARTEAKGGHGASGHADKVGDEKGDTPVVGTGLVLARWEKAADSSRERPEAVAVDNAGSRVLVQVPRGVNVWAAGDPKARRVQPKNARRAFVAPDAAHMYFVNSEKSGWRLETCDADGKRIGVWGPDPNRRCELGAVGFHPTTHELTVGIGFEEGYALQAVSSASGQPQPARVLTHAADAPHADRLFPHAGGHMIHFHTFQGAGHPPGLYALTAAGAVERTAAVPTDSATSAVLPRPAVSPDGHRVAVLDGNTVRVLDLTTGRRVFSWEQAAHRPQACWFAGGRLIVAATAERGSAAARPTLFQTYDLGSSRMVGQFRPGNHALPEAAFAFSPDGSKLALASGDEVVLVDANVAFGLSR